MEDVGHGMQPPSPSVPLNLPRGHAEIDIHNCFLQLCICVKNLEAIIMMLCSYNLPMHWLFRFSKPGRHWQVLV